MRCRLTLVSTVSMCVSIVSSRCRRSEGGLTHGRCVHGVSTGVRVSSASRVSFVSEVGACRGEVERVERVERDTPDTTDTSRYFDTHTLTKVRAQEEQASKSKSKTFEQHLYHLPRRCRLAHRGVARVCHCILCVASGPARRGPPAPPRHRSSRGSSTSWNSRSPAYRPVDMLSYMTGPKHTTLTGRVHSAYSRCPHVQA